MKAAAFALVLLGGAGQAEVIECPAAHQGARLIGAGMHQGEQKEAELMGERKRVRGGIEAKYGFNRGDVKWVACWYAPATPRWYPVSPTATRCELKERETTPGRMTAVVRCK